MACPNESFLWREQLVEPLPAAAHVRARALLKRPTTKPCASYPQPPPRKWWAQAPRDATGFLVAFFTEAVLNVVFAGAVFSGAPALRGDAPASSAAPLDAATQRATFQVLCAATVGFTGVALLLSSRLRCLRLAEVLPYPCICGLLSGVGCLVLRLCGSLSVSRGGGFLEDASHVAPTLLLGGVVFGIFKLRLHPALLAPPLAVASACFYGAVGVSPEALAGARGRGWLFDAPSANGDGGAWVLWGASGAPDPGALSACAPTALALVALALLKNSLMLLAMDRALELPAVSMLFAQGCGLLFDWFAAPLAKLDAAETAVVVVIVLTMVSAGLLRGVALGAACSFCLLAANAFKVPLVRAKTTGRKFRSTHDRWLGAATALDRDGDVGPPGRAGRGRRRVLRGLRRRTPRWGLRAVAEGGGFDVEFFATLDGALDAAEDALLRRRGVDGGASTSAAVSRRSGLPASRGLRDDAHFVAVREVTALERDDPRAALALYKVVASVNTAIANRCKMALGRMATRAFDNLG
ncbi:sulfate transporter [Aureococcus anophagefferens]|uniref:Sulfate transporter n=1 Tax=Aureococcus anophagefferens TaxID=44056 RepID=A0ABR1FIX5_AURAN